jgi:transcriptional regulator with XRE-family HTH domain
MKTTIDFLNAVKAAQGLTSDYQLAKFLGITASSISLSMSGRTFLGDETAIKVADSLKIDPAQVIASVHYERAKKAEEKAVWKGILERLGGIAAALFIGVALYQFAPNFTGDPALFLAGLTGAGNIHYTNYQKPTQTNPRQNSRDWRIAQQQEKLVEGPYLYPLKHHFTFCLATVLQYQYCHSPSPNSKRLRHFHS